MYYNENITLLSVEQLIEIMPEHLSLHKDSGSHQFVNSHLDYESDKDIDAIFALCRNHNETLIDFIRRVYDAEIRTAQAEIDSKASHVLALEAAENGDRDDIAKRAFGDSSFFDMTMNELSDDINLMCSKFGLWQVKKAA